jgi:nucleotide-binding universal stress UspA family protein
LTQTVHSIGEEGGKHKELVAKINQDTLTEAEAYLKNVAQRFSTGDLAEFHLQVTLSVVPHSNATEIWKRIVEEAMGTAQTPSCDIIAMATHGRHGLQHLLEGSITESVLDASAHPLLVVHNQEAQAKEETLEETHHA